MNELLAGYANYASVESIVGEGFNAHETPDARSVNFTVCTPFSVVSYPMF
jgi:hypothetical protein